MTTAAPARQLQSDIEEVLDTAAALGKAYMERYGGFMPSDPAMHTLMTCLYLRRHADARLQRDVYSVGPQDLTELHLLHPDGTTSPLVPPHP